MPCAHSIIGARIVGIPPSSRVVRSTIAQTALVGYVSTI